jgi:hypothetical protein
MAVAPVSVNSSFVKADWISDLNASMAAAASDMVDSASCRALQ